MKEKIAIFIGHNDITGLNIELVEQTSEELIKNGITTFLSGGMGGFDRIAAKIICNMKKTYPYIKNNIVIPYLNFNVFDSSLFDEIIFPEELEGVYYKAAIPKRNKYMIELADTAVCFVKYNFGGAAKSFEYAKKQNINIINLI